MYFDWKGPVGPVVRSIQTQEKRHDFYCRSLLFVPTRIPVWRSPRTGDPRDDVNTVEQRYLNTSRVDSTSKDSCEECRIRLTSISPNYHWRSGEGGVRNLKFHLGVDNDFHQTFTYLKSWYLSSVYGRNHTKERRTLLLSPAIRNSKMRNSLLSYDSKRRRKVKWEEKTIHQPLRSLRWGSPQKQQKSPLVSLLLS